MRIETVKLPKEEKAITEAFGRILKAVTATGVVVDPEGLGQAWMGDNTRLCIAYDGEQPKGFALMIYGRRWYDVSMTASVIICEGDARPQLMEHLKQLALVLGAESFIFDHRDGDPFDGEPTDLRVVHLE